MVLVFLAEGFEEIEALTPVDILLRGGIDVKTVGIGGKCVKGSHGITVTADLTPDEVDPERIDGVILPGGMPGAENLFSSDFVKTTVTDTYNRGRRVAAICAAPLVLGRLGLLEDKNATCYPGFEEELKGARLCDESVVTDGRITTAKGMGVALDFALELLLLLKGYDEAERVKNAIMLPVPEEEKEENSIEELFKIFEEITENTLEGESEDEADEYTPVYTPNPEPFTSNEDDFPEYEYPLTGLLGAAIPEMPDRSEEIAKKTEALHRIFSEFELDARVCGVDVGESFSLFKLELGKKATYNKLVKIGYDIALLLGYDNLRILAPIPGTALAGIEIMNDKRTPLMLRSLLDNPDFIESDSPNNLAIGRTVQGEDIYLDLSTLPHLLVAGAAGSGKSITLHNIIVSLLYGALPNEVRLILVDPKKVEFTAYVDVPHLLVPVIDEPKNAIGALKWLNEEMERRYERLERLKVRNISQYNSLCEDSADYGDPMPRIVMIIDELSDLMLYDKSNTEGLIMRLTQKARAAGIHIIIGTCDPTPRTLTGVIKANIPSRIALHCATNIDSRSILDMPGAEKLARGGDMLLVERGATPVRLQGAFVANGDIYALTDYLRRVGEFRRYDEDVIEEMGFLSGMSAAQNKPEKCENDDTRNAFCDDECFLNAVDTVLANGKASTSLLQRKLCIGYGKAAKYIDAMEELGIVSEPDGARPRDVLITPKEWLDKLAELQGDK